MVNSSKMGLKHNNPNGEIVLESKCNLVQQFEKFLKITFRNEFYKLFFQEDV